MIRPEINPRERMSSKERVLTAFAHREPDRVPVDYSAQPEAKNMSPAYLKERYGEWLAFHGCHSWHADN
jgi:hypothetical protein